MGIGNIIVPIELVTDTELPDRIDNAITAPTTDYPIICFYNEKINIFPDTIDFGVYLMYVKKPITPAYVRVLDAYNRGRYLASDFYTLTITVGTDPTNGQTHGITVNYNNEGAVQICNYTAATADGLTKQVLAQKMAESVNNLHSITGYFASVGTEEFTIYLNSSVGVAADYVVVETGTGSANFIAASPLEDGAGGSTQLEFDEIYHFEIIRLIIGYLGIDIKDSVIIQAMEEV